jgi:hypothetical protein
MTQVMKVSKTTKNVLTVGNKDLIFSSELATHMIYSIVTFQFSGTDTDDDITHGLGYVPKVWILYATNSSSTFRNRIPVLTGVGTGYDYYITDNVIHLHRDSGFGSNYYKIIIFTRSFIP